MHMITVYYKITVSHVGSSKISIQLPYMITI